MSVTDLVGWDADEQIEVLAEDRVPFTQIPDWIVFSPLTPQARALYDILAAHVNQARGDETVWPTRETLAALLRFNRPQSIDRYLDELEDLGAILKETRKTHGGMRSRNAYRVRFNPPKAYAGPTTIVEFYAARKAAALAV